MSIEIEYGEPHAETVDRWLANWLNTVDFKLAGAGQGLGLDIVHAVANGIAARSAIGQDADGNPWAPNSTKPSKWHKQGYAAWKEEKYGFVDAPGYRTGNTLSLVNLIGTTTIDTHEIIMRGGIDEPPSGSKSPSGYISDADKKATSLDKLRWLHEATATKPARPAYAYSQADVDEVLRITVEYVSAHVVATNAGNA